MKRITTLSSSILLVIALVGIFYAFSLRPATAPADDVPTQGAPPQDAATATDNDAPDTPVLVDTSRAITSPTASQFLPYITATTVVYTYQVISEYPHDPDAFTQGLIWADGGFYEGTGLYGPSSLRKVALETGEVERSIQLGDQYFGEGITLWQDRIIQLTWRKNIGFVYNKDTFEKQREFGYSTEGWGITHDGERLIVSDGTANLYFWDPETLAEIGRVTVTRADQPVTQLNELEYIDGLVYANVWQTDEIVVIQPETGFVVAQIDLTGLLKPEDRTGSENVLNGIAFDAKNQRLFVTGKLWPKLFEIVLVEKEE